MPQAEIGVIGGSGLYQLASQSDLHEVALETPWGDPSGPYRIGTVGSKRVAFLARHGVGHRLMPAEINYRANIWGFRMLGVTRLISASAVGSLRQEIHPRHFVAVDQFIDRTQGRPATFFGEGLVAHVSLADPTCTELRSLAVESVRAAGAACHGGGTYVCISGPQFSTRAESRLFAAWGAHVVGMTNLTEARLCREAEICYAPLAMVTDYDCWKDDEPPVSVDALLEVLHENARAATHAIGNLVARLPQRRDCPCSCALESALITDRAAIPGATRERLHLLLGRYLG